MNPWLESFLVALLALAGVWLGRWFSQRPKPLWLLGYFIPLGLILLYGLARQGPSLAFIPPISWMMMGRNKFAVVGFIATMVLTTPLSRLRRKRDRVMVSVLMVVIVWLMSVWPFLAPAFNRRELAALQTRIDADGICRQSNDYDCGPAAAVTALRKLGFPAEEGEIAILAHATSSTGTEPDVLALVLQQRYGKDGLVAEYRVFNDVAELKSAGLTLAVVKFNLLTDHFVTVLEVTDQEVIVGDPMSGLARLSLDEFRAQWRFTGVALKRNPKF
jgi:hypothetical protein